MSEIEHFTEQKFQEILRYVYEKGQKTEDVKLEELLEEIRQQVLMKK